MYLKYLACIMCIDKYVKMTHKVADQDDGLAGRRFDLRHAVDGRVDVIVAREPKTHKSKCWTNPTCGQEYRKI